MARRRFLFALAALFVTVNQSPAASPTPEQALSLRPVQKEVEYDAPTGEAVKACAIKAGKVGRHSGWIVRDPSGQMLRTFIDTNNDNVVDMWCYFRNGIEVYRDMDSNFNGKADQYRWLHTGGVRWGHDRDEDGQIDSWKMISAEEATAEVVSALAHGDNGRFARLLLKANEIPPLGLGKDRAAELAKKLPAAAAGFVSLAKTWPAKAEKTKWLHFGAVRPGVAPKGTDGSSRDLVVYENVVALLEIDGRSSQLWIGTMLNVNGSWKLIDAPKLLPEGKTAVASEQGFFFRAAPAQQQTVEIAQKHPGDDKMQKLLSQLETIDAKLPKETDAAAAAKLNGQRASLLEQLAAASGTAKDRQGWLKQLADTASAAAQAGRYPGGVERLKDLYEAQQKAGNEELAGYIKFRYLTAEYALSLQGKPTDFPIIQKKWLASLEKYVTDYPQSPDTAEALLQLAIAEEFAEEEKKAQSWYQKVLSGFASSAAAKKARGALKRLQSVGKPVSLKGATTKGQRFDLARFQGRVVLIHYWASWSELCVNDIKKIKELYAKYGNKGFVPVGVNLDHNKSELTQFLSGNRLPWPQLYEPGSLDGRLANEMGILTLPTMLLIDKHGKVINRNLHISQLEDELKKLLR